MEYIVELALHAGEDTLDRLMDELDLTGQEAEVLMAAYENGVVSIVFQVNSITRLAAARAARRAIREAETGAGLPYGDWSQEDLKEAV